MIKIKQIMEDPTALREVFKCTFKVPIVADFKTGAWSKGVKYEF
jgi:hypothetical protein